MATEWLQRLLKPWHQMWSTKKFAQETLNLHPVPGNEGVEPDIHEAVRSVLGGKSLPDDLGAEIQSLAQEIRDRQSRIRNETIEKLVQPRWLFWTLGTLIGYLTLQHFWRLKYPSPYTSWIEAGLGAALFLSAAIPAWRLKNYWNTSKERWQVDLWNKVLGPFTAKMSNQKEKNRDGREVNKRKILVVGYGPDPAFSVSSHTMDNVAAAARAVGSGSIGISGPRGAGKSTILNNFNTRNNSSNLKQDIRINVSAPVNYDAREFIIHLFGKLCAEVMEMAPRGTYIRAETQRQHNSLHYLNTYSSSWGGNLSSTIGSLSGNRGRARAEQPAGLPEIVSRFRDYSEEVAQWNQSRGSQSNGRLVICIDEMDKIRDSDRAEQFLNDIKAIFDVPGCLYLVSLSEDAMRVFASQAPAIRTAFDSAFDEIISVSPMTLTEARNLLDQRVIGLDYPFLDLCHVLSGGIPRELIRNVRALVHVAESQEPRNRSTSSPQASQKHSLSYVAQKMVDEKCAAIREQAISQLSRIGASADILNLIGQLPRSDESIAERDLKELSRKLSDAVDGQDEDECVKMCKDVAVGLRFYATVSEQFRDKQISEIAVGELANIRHTMWINTKITSDLLRKYQRESRENHGVGN